MALLERMDPAKDADGLHPINLGRLVHMVDAPLPCTPHGIVLLLRSTACRSRAPRSSWSAAASRWAARSACC